MLQESHNPYQSPAPTLVAGRSRFRPSAMDSWACWILRRRRSVNESGELVVGRPRIACGIIWFYCVGAGMISIAFNAFRRDVLQAASERPVPVLFFVFLFVYWTGTTVLLIAAARCCVIFSPDRIQVVELFRTRQLAWTDIVSVHFTNGGRITLMNSQNIKCHIAPAWAGVEGVADFLERYLPRDVLADCEDDLRVYREFVRTAPTAAAVQHHSWSS